MTIYEQALAWARAQDSGPYPVDAYSAGYRAAVADAVAKVLAVALKWNDPRNITSANLIAAELEKLGEP